MADGGWQGFIHMGVLTLMAGNVFAAIVGLLMNHCSHAPGKLVARIRSVGIDEGGNRHA